MDNSPWLEAHGTALYLKAHRFLYKWRVIILNVFLFGFIPLVVITFFIAVEGFSVWLIWAFFPGEVIMMLTFFGLTNNEIGTVRAAIFAMFFPLSIYVHEAMDFRDHLFILPYEQSPFWHFGARSICTAMIPAILYHILQIFNYMDDIENQHVEEIVMVMRT